MTHRISTNPADPDVARLLGWSELGRGTAIGDTVHIGQLELRMTAATGIGGSVRAFYRPEDIQLGPTPPGGPATGVAFTAHVEHVILTRPLARISLGSDPPITALMLHRDVEDLQLTPGQMTQGHLPAGSLRIFQLNPPAGD